ncbi:acetyl-CoA synthetase [Komagataeibacter saccharivorans]|uniref:AMP-binding protein n=1 Tax=Komagataeibacter saccharivorans TaxID=265959 RepID=UPI000D7CEFE6|nr:AMP-binding protein [Komagataeibacter saccharivorans]PYD50620.1 acetyl-CoA synthetase [Komagataeibacter saccharivorans]
MGNRPMMRRTFDSVSILSALHSRQYIPRQAGYVAPSHIIPVSKRGQRIQNICASCVDYHLGDHADRSAVIWRGAGNTPNGRMSYRELHERVCRLANTLQDQGVQRGDRVAIHLPLIAESIVAVLACMRIGAVHVVLPTHLDAQALAERLGDCGATAILTGDQIRCDTGPVPLKVTLDTALDMGSSHSRINTVLVVTINKTTVPMQSGRDHRYDAVVDWYEPDYAPVAMYENDPLFMLYPNDRPGGFGTVKYTAGEYSRLADYTMDMLASDRNGGTLPGMLDMTWNTGQTALVAGVLAKGGTLTLSAGLSAS